MDWPRGSLKQMFKKHKNSLLSASACLKRVFEFQSIVLNRGGAEMPWDTTKPVVARLLITVMLAGAVGGLLHGGQWVRMTEPPRGRAVPASLEMMQLLRDEHGRIADMVKAQLAIPSGGFDSKPIAATERRQVIALR
jgi:hypothetical protein